MDLPRTVPSAAGKLLAARYGGLFVETSYVHFIPHRLR